MTSSMTSRAICVRGAQLDADDADPGHAHDERDAERQGPPVVVGGPSRPNSRNVYCAAMSGQAGHDDEVGDHDAPAARSSPVRGPIDRVTHAEVGPAVRVGPVEVVEGGRDAAHRDERDPHDRRGLEADRGGDEARARRRGCTRARWRRPRPRWPRPDPSAPAFRPLLSVTPPRGASTSLVMRPLLPSHAKACSEIRRKSATWQGIPCYERMMPTDHRY